MTTTMPSAARRRAWRGAVLGAVSLGLVVLPAAAADHDVEVGDSFYAPDDITVRAGDTVNWTYQGELPHNVAFEDGSWQSRDFATDGSPDTISYTFEEPGTVLYYCTYHASCENGECSGPMWATVTVEAAQTASPSESEPTPEPTATSEPEPTAQPTPTEAPTPAPTGTDPADEVAPDTEADAEAAAGADDMPDTGNTTPALLAVAMILAGGLSLRRWSGQH